MPCYLLYVLRLTMQYSVAAGAGINGDWGEESAGRGDTARVTRSRGPMLWVIRIRRQALENSCLQYYIFRKEGFIDINDIIQLACMLDGRAP